MEIEFDYSKLRGRIVERYDTLDNFAQDISFSGATLSRKLNNRSRFEDVEILEISELLGIPKNKLDSYFFTLKVRKNEQATA